MPFAHVQPGDPLRAEDYNRRGDLLNQLANLLTPGGTSGGSVGGIASFQNELQPLTFFAKITSAADANGAYSWTEQRPSSGFTFVDRPNGRSGTQTVNPVYEMSGSRTVQRNSIVVMWKGTPSLGTTKQEWLCNGGSGSGRYPLLAKLTSSSGTRYAWTEQEPLTGGGFQNRSGGLSGTISANSAYELNGKTGLSDLSPQPIVHLWPGFYNSSSDQEYLFALPEFSLRITDLWNTLSYDWIKEIQFDSTPTAYDDTQGDWIITYDAATRSVTIRLNGYLGNFDVLAICDNGQLLKRNITCSNGLTKIVTEPAI